MWMIPLKAIGLAVDLKIKIASGSVLSLVLNQTCCSKFPNAAIYRVSCLQLSTDRQENCYKNDRLHTVSPGYSSKLAMCRSKQISLKSYLRFFIISQIFPRIVPYINCWMSTSERLHKNGRKLLIQINLLSRFLCLEEQQWQQPVRFLSEWA